jgi:hypothetical protein
MRHVEAYLAIPEEIARAGGGLVWSLDGEAIKREDGTTFALTEEALIFLEGFALSRPPIAFGYLLLTLGVLRGRCGPKPGASVAVDRARDAFQAAGRSERNAGAFFGHLLASVPGAPDAPTVWEVWRRAVLNASDPLRLATQEIKTPPLPLSAEAFLRGLEQSLSSYSAEDLLTWFRTGVGPEREAGRKLADALQTRTMRSLEGLLGDQAERQRLAGALPLIEQLGAALTLPPRKLIDPGLPLGGYSDVTNHGKFEQLLLSQFALDELELLRRLAERELLYYRREEPRAEVREELLVILDQGVRTWGVSRLVLLAATFALADLAARRKHVFRIVTTSRAGDPWAPEDLAPQELASRLERSDLSPHPGRALERVLADKPKLPRDVVLLTHPRCLAELDVIAAARTVPAEVRLFALSADREGHASLGEFQHGHCVPLRDFRVDLGVRRKKTPVKPGEMVRPPAWSGPVDPNPSLFFIHPGPGKPTLFAFDAAERHLLLSLADGALMLVPLHGRAEMLPRVQVAGGILRQVEWIHGVPGGFVLGGVSEGQAVVARYHLDDRRAEAWAIGEAGMTEDWCYVADLDCVAHFTRYLCRTLDLQTGEQRQGHSLPGSGMPHDNSRATAAIRAVREGGHSPEWLRVIAEPSSGVRQWLWLDSVTGELECVTPTAVRFIHKPGFDGEPALLGGELHRGQFREQVIAIEVTLPEASGRPAGRYLHAYRIDPPPAQLLLQIRLRDKGDQHWTLSPQGNFVAFETGQGQAEIRSTQPGNARKQVTPRCRVEVWSGVLLGAGWLLLFGNGLGRLLDWSGADLRSDAGPGTASDARGFLARTLPPRGLSLKEATVLDKRPAFLAPDAGRYHSVFLARLVAAMDRIGVISLFDITGGLIAQVYTRGDKWAVATPDGHRMGDPSLLGGPATADAAVEIAARLRAAERLAPESWS